MQRSKDDAERQVVAMKEEVKAAEKERDIARDLASSLVQEQTSMKQQVQKGNLSDSAVQVGTLLHTNDWTHEEKTEEATLLGIMTGPSRHRSSGSLLPFDFECRLATQVE